MESVNMSVKVKLSVTSVCLSVCLSLHSFVSTLSFDVNCISVCLKEAIKVVMLGKKTAQIMTS